MPKKDDNENRAGTSHASTTDPSRRDFLKGSVTAAGVGLAAAAATGLPAAEAALLMVLEELEERFPVNR